MGIYPARAIGQLRRAGKRARLSLRPRRHVNCAVFITGCQRSGTKMTLKTLDQSADVWTHDHRKVDVAYLFSHDPAYQMSQVGTLARLLPIDQLRALIDRSSAPIVAFHAIADSQNSTELLAGIPRAKIIWIYRHYVDVARSAVNLWGDHQRDLIRRFRDGKFDELKWRAEKMTKDEIEKISQCWRDDLTPEEGAALIWYARNQFYFQLRLEESSRVLLVNYETFVADPAAYCPRIFEFIDAKFDTAYVKHIFSSSVRRDRKSSYSSDVTNLCENLMHKLDQAHLAVQRCAPSERAVMAQG
jgi:hypothetical protein